VLTRDTTELRQTTLVALQKEVEKLRLDNKDIRAKFKSLHDELFAKEG